MKEIVAVLVNIRSAWNVGSMFRTADAMGVSKLYLVGYTPTPLDPAGGYRRDVAKVALGAETWMPWEKTAKPGLLLARLKKEGYRICAVELSPRAVPLGRVKVKRSERIALIMGNEVKGLSPAVLRRADTIIEIPMRGKKESLNVAVAFGVAAYRFAEQKRSGRGRSV